MAKTDRGTSEKVVETAKKTVGNPNIVEYGRDTQFSPENQPDPELKRKGWEKRNAQRAILEAFNDFSLLSYKKLKELVAKIQQGDYTDLQGNDLSVAQVKAVKYLINNKADIDFINRAVPYAKQEVDLSADQTLTIRHVTDE